MAGGGPYAAALTKAEDWEWTAVAQGNWHHFLCRSKPLFCASPGVPAQGGVMLSSQNYGIGTTAFYYCNYGFLLRGIQSRACLANGTWSDAPPACFRECPAPPLSLSPDRRCSGCECSGRCSRELRDAVGAAKRGRAAGERDDELRGPGCLRVRPRLPTRGGRGARVRRGRGLDGRPAPLHPRRLPPAPAPPQRHRHPRLQLHRSLLLPHRLSLRNIGVKGMGAVAQYGCRPGHRLVGSRIRHCADTGAWTPAAPACFSEAETGAFPAAAGPGIAPGSEDPAQWRHQTSTAHIDVQLSVAYSKATSSADLMTGFIVAVVVLLIMIFLILFLLWK